MSGNTMKVSGFYHLLYIGTPPFQQSEKGKYSCIFAAYFTMPENFIGYRHRKSKWVKKKLKRLFYLQNSGILFSLMIMFLFPKGKYLHRFLEGIWWIQN